MRGWLRVGGRRYVVLTRHEGRSRNGAVQYRERMSAVQFVRGLLADQSALRTLRAILEESGAPRHVGRLNDAQVVELIADRVQSGVVTICEADRPVLAGGGDASWEVERAEQAEGETAEEGMPSDPPAIAEPEVALSWIEVELLDVDGAPIAEQRCRVIDADGNTHEGMTDAAGVYRVSAIRSGECRISFPGLSDAPGHAGSA